MKIGSYEFVFIETIELIKTKDGTLSYEPQSRYKNAGTMPLHEYGEGAFCRFKLKNAKDVSGVYAWVIDDEVVYIGEATNFRKRFNMGYGVISPRNCYIGGQITNCKMNKVVWKEYEKSNRIQIYFYETPHYKEVEEELLLSITTKYNVKNNKR